MTKKYHSLLFTIEVEDILAQVSEYNNHFVTENDAEQLLYAMEQNLNDWFYENVGSVIRTGIEDNIHDVMNPKKEND
jgi:hypothetical protein